MYLYVVANVAVPDCIWHDWHDRIDDNVGVLLGSSVELGVDHDHERIERARQRFRPLFDRAKYGDVISHRNDDRRGKDGDGRASRDALQLHDQSARAHGAVNVRAVDCDCHDGSGVLVVCQ